MPSLGFLKNRKSEFQLPSKYEIHDGPQEFREGNSIQVFYDLTDHLSEEDSDLSIRQDVFLKTNEKDSFEYLTQSKSIQASGTASYLKKVSFFTKVSSHEGYYLVDLENDVQVERPWFAISFLFKPISASITKDKFEKARDKLIEYLLSDRTI